MFVITAQVNGVEVSRSVTPRLTLVELLRDDLGLTGTKVSCELQVCGVCTVLVDGRPVSACTFLAVDVDGASVETVEGLATDGELHPLQQAFVDELALQCGFCTPGFLMMSKALLDSTPAPTRHEIVEHLDGNICRCTGYEPIVRAVECAARRLRGDGADA
jgi:aerobic-type carbon monoxide dehydrogenase small subunit (CoxS/CutS family)